MKLKEMAYLQFLKAYLRRISLSVLMIVFLIIKANSQVRTYHCNYTINGPAEQIPYDDLLHLNSDSTCEFVRIKNFERQNADTIRYHGTWSRAGNNIFLDMVAEKISYGNFKMCLKQKRRRLNSVSCLENRNRDKKYFLKEIRSKPLM